MKKNNQIFAILMAVLLCASGCGKDENRTLDTQEKPLQNNDEVTAEIPETDDRIPTSVPDDLNFDGESFRFLSRMVEDTVVRYYSEVSSSETNGESMNDAVYERTLRLEDRFGIKIIDETAQQVSRQVRSAVNAGEDNWDVVIPNFADAMSMVLNGGYFQDLLSLPYIDIDKPWWDSRTAHEMSFAGKIYAAIGAMNTWTDSHTYAVVFNKELAKEFDIDSYQLVRDNHWTLDTFQNLIREVSMDINGDGVSDETDRWGAVSEYACFPMMMLGCDVTLITHDSEDLPVYSVDDRLFQAAEKITAVLAGGDCILAEQYSGKYRDPWTEVLRGCFRAGRGLYYIGGIEQLIIFRDLETDIGLLPMPKYDEAQKDYAHTFSQHWSSIMAVPVTAANPEKVGALLEAMNADSYYSTAKTYYDVILKSKAMRDEDSCQMMDIIRASRTIDLESAFDFMGVSTIYNDILAKKDVGILASKIAKAQTKADKKIEKVINTFSNQE